VKPNGEKIPFVTYGKLDSARQFAIARHSLQTNGPFPENLGVYLKQSSGFVYDLKIKNLSPVIYTIEQLPDAHLPIWFGPRLDRESERAHLGRFLKDSMYWFGSKRASLPKVEVGEPQATGFITALLRWLRGDVPVFPLRVHGHVATFVLPTGREVSVVLTAATPKIVRRFGKEYLRTRCGYDGALSVVQENVLRFRMQLRGPLPSIPGTTTRTLSIQFSSREEMTSFQWQWQWPPYTLISDVFADIAAMLQVPRNELTFSFSDDGPVIRHYFQLFNVMKKDSLLVVRKRGPVTLTLAYGDLRRNVDLRDSDHVIELRPHALELVLSPGEVSSLQTSDLVLSVGDHVLTDGMQICELRQDVVTVTVPSIVKVHFKLETGAEPRLLEGVFPAEATVKDGRDWVSQEIDQPSDKISFFYGGRELRDTQRLSRLQPDNFVLIWVEEGKDVLLQSMKCLQMKPKPIHFVCEPDNEAFDIEFHGGDLIDAVRVRVAAKFSVDPMQIQLWFADQLLFDDVMIDAIGLGDDSYISVVVKSAEDVLNLRSLRNSIMFNSLYRFDTFSSSVTGLKLAAGPGDVADLPEPNTYDQITPDELKLIQQIMNARSECHLSENDAVLKFLEYNRDVERLKVAFE
jgi:hypothetical protein